MEKHFVTAFATHISTVTGKNICVDDYTCRPVQTEFIAHAKLIMESKIISQ